MAEGDDAAQVEAVVDRICSAISDVTLSEHEKFDLELTLAS
jgi:hypothetical protein